MVNNILEVVNLSLPFALKELSISFKENAITGVSGPNNCGKTTLIKTLSRTIFTSEAVFLFSKDLATYKQVELSKTISEIIPEMLNFNFKSLSDGLDYLVYKNILQKNDEFSNQVIKDFKLTKKISKDFKKLSIKDQIKTILAFMIIKKNKIFMLDDILIYFNGKEKKELIDIILKYKEKEKLTIIMTISNLEDCLFCDYLYIMDKGDIVLNGKPLDVLEKDNILNKLGLDLPFMVDLSVKLRDYDLISDLELDQERLVNKLWN